jgi:hypothetical protein
MTGPTAGLVVTPFPMEGHNFRCQDGRVRGVTATMAEANGRVTVDYLDDTQEVYDGSNVQEVTTK